MRVTVLGGAAWNRMIHVERLPDASHWVAEDRPLEVNTLLLDFLLSPFIPLSP